MARQYHTSLRTNQLDASPSSSRIPASLTHLDTVYPAGEFIAPVSEREMIKDQPWVQMFAGGAIAFVGLMWLGELETMSKRAATDRRTA
jgi:hypothetical protein